MTTMIAVRITFRDHDQMTIGNVYNVSYDSPWIVIRAESEDMPGETAVVKIHADIVATFVEGPIEVTK